MRKIITVLLFVIFTTYFTCISWGEVSLSSRYNYLYVLVHSKGTSSGIFDGREKIQQFGIEFSRLKQYLEREFSLEGYVYSYDFSSNELDIAHQGWELGDRNYVGDLNAIHRDSPGLDEETKRHKVKVVDGINGKRRLSFLEQAREDFIDWYYEENKNKLGYKSRNDVPDSVIPKEYILIAHCMGGLAIRHYIYGKDQNGRRYYRNDVAKVIFIATPHLGANGVMMKDVWDAAQRNAPVILVSNLAAAFVSSREGK